MRIWTFAGTTRILLRPSWRTIASRSLFMGAVMWLFTMASMIHEIGPWTSALGTLPVAIALAAPAAYLSLSPGLRITRRHLVIRHPKEGPISIPRDDIEAVSFVPLTQPDVGHLRFEFVRHYAMSAGGPLATMHESLNSPQALTIDEFHLIKEAIAAIPASPSRTLSPTDGSPQVLRALAGIALLPIAVLAIPSLLYPSGMASFAIFQVLLMSAWAGASIIAFL